jgi:hypothetical protein
LKNLDNNVDINRAWEGIGRNIKASATESKFVQVETTQIMVPRRVLKMIRSREAG